MFISVLGDAYLPYGTVLYRTVMYHHWALFPLSVSSSSSLFPLLLLLLPFFFHSVLSSASILHPSLLLCTSYSPFSFPFSGIVRNRNYRLLSELVPAVKPHIHHGLSHSLFITRPFFSQRPPHPPINPPSFLAVRVGDFDCCSLDTATSLSSPIYHLPPTITTTTTTTATKLRSNTTASIHRIRPLTRLWVLRPSPPKPRSLWLLACAIPSRIGRSTGSPPVKPLSLFSLLHSCRPIDQSSRARVVNFSTVVLFLLLLSPC